MSKNHQAKAIMMNKEIFGNKKGIGTRAKTYKIGLGLIMALLIMAVRVPYTHARPVAAVNLGSAGNYVILAETTITTTGTTHITGDIGLSPAASSYFTGFSQVMDSSNQFSTSSLVTGRLYAATYADPTPATLTTAVTDMGTAYTTANGQATTDPMGTTDLNGQTLAPGVYAWTSNLAITGDFTISGSSSDVWIFKIPGTLTVSSGVVVTLSGGATYNNIFWVVGGQTTLVTTVSFQGIILDYTSIAMQAGATLTGRALAQAAVTLISNTISLGQTAEGIILAPASSTNPLGTSHTVTSIVTGPGGPMVGSNVTFRVVSGPNAGLTSSVLTGSNGRASFAYMSSVPGTDTIEASFVNSQEATVTSNQVTKTWASESPTAVGGKIVPIDTLSVLSVLLSQYSAVIVLLIILIVPLGFLLVRKRNKVLSLIIRLLRARA
jgi:hypothetical protein